MGVWKKKESERQCQICCTDTGNAFNIANVYYLYYKHKEEETPSLNQSHLAKESVKVEGGNVTEG